MKNFLLLLIFVTTISASAQSKDATMRQEIANPDNFQFITINGRAAGEAFKPCANSLEECGNERLVLYGYEGFGGDDSENPKTETFIFKNGKKTVGIFLFTMKSDGDDSVKAERVRIAFEKKGKNWQLVQAGKQFQCMRGATRNKWTKNLCP